MLLIALCNIRSVPQRYGSSVDRSYNVSARPSFQPGVAITALRDVKSVSSNFSKTTYLPVVCPMSSSLNDMPEHTTGLKSSDRGDNSKQRNEKGGGWVIAP